jgi:hypothetical protein
VSLLNMDLDMQLPQHGPVSCNDLGVFKMGCSTGLASALGTREGCLHNRTLIIFGHAWGREHRSFLADSLERQTPRWGRPHDGAGPTMGQTPRWGRPHDGARRLEL